jgi:cell division protein FtsB
MALPRGKGGEPGSAAIYWWSNDIDWRPGKMSAVIKRKRQKGPSGSTVALWVVLGLAAAFFLVRYGQELLLAHSLSDKAAAQRIINNDMRDENARLKASLEYYQSDKYIEQRAREDLNLRRPDEEVLIPIMATPEAGLEGTTLDSSPSEQSGPRKTTTPPGSQTNWQKWLDLFSPSP